MLYNRNTEDGVSCKSKRTPRGLTFATDHTEDGIFVKITALPYRIHGYSRMNMDGSYTIFLNAHDSIERQEESKRHEVEHIYKGDYDSCGVLVDAVERARHEV
jgi:hypothetical protein